ncbi:hypothetical protein PYCCODRAFT_1427123 [Trametes coccinea BRFM310]|uniref:Uncharacterized protein n=1 Tax=Trametes coccinea (strain BRFM310) TaxID=1353009 RepID=A0A1Y2IEB8_TRAC3|nr:hypothetical protein PYCCODRAFT_1427123 [Trametes coccinea BRFM310]
MILLNPPYYFHDASPEDSPPLPPPRHLAYSPLPSQPLPQQRSLAFQYALSSQPYPQYDPFLSQGPPFAQQQHQQQQFMPPHHHHQHAHPSQSRPIPPSLLNDPAFSPDPRSNPFFFSMNDREEIYPASVADSLSEGHGSSLHDDESEIDHNKLPPRLRLLHSPDVGPQQLPQHPRSHTGPSPYAPVVPPEHQPSQSHHHTPVIPVPPPTSRSSPLSNHLRKPSRDDPHEVSRSSSAYTSASVAAREHWNAPPAYTDSESGSSSSSNPQTPASSSSHLPRDAQRSTSSLNAPADKSYPPRPQPLSTSSSSVQFPVQQPTPAPTPAPAPAPAAPPSATQTSTVQSTAARPSLAPRNVSAPELQPPPPPTDLPPRPSTVPIASTPSSAPSVSAPVAQRKRSKNPSISAPPRDLDKIDELDESDPLGARWHHDGPYEAIMKAAPVLYPEQSILAQKRNDPSKRKPVQPYDSFSLGVSPGQIFPSNSHYQAPAPSAPAQAQQGYQPHAHARAGSAQSENIPPGSPLLQVPVQRRMPSSGQLPSSPEMYNNMHMGAQQLQQQQRQAAAAAANSRVQAARAEESPQPSPPLPNPYSPAEATFQHQQQSPPQAQRYSPPHSRGASRDDIPRPDIALPPQQPPQQPHRQQSQQSSSKSSAPSLMPRHLPKRLVMPAPLQSLPQAQQPNAAPAAHVEVLAQRHVSSGPHPQHQHAHLHHHHSSSSSRPQQQQQQPTQGPGTGQRQQQQQQPSVRAQDIPMNHGPKVLRKKHASTSAAGPPVSPGNPPLMPAGGGAGEIPASNTTAALFAARVRFAEPAREETKEEKKRREKEEARRAKEREKAERAREKERGGGGGLLGAIFSRDHAKEAELAREREREMASAAAKSSGRKLSKRR